MTIPASALPYLPACPVWVQRIDGTRYCEDDQQAVRMLVEGQCIEAVVAPKSGLVRFLRMIVAEDVALTRIAAAMPSEVQTPGSVICGDASCYSFRQHLPGGFRVWTHKPGIFRPGKEFDYGRSENGNQNGN